MKEYKIKWQKKEWYKEATELRQENKPWRDIAEILNGRGHLSALGNPYKEHTISNAYRNEIRRRRSHEMQGM